MNAKLEPLKASTPMRTIHVLITSLLQAEGISHQTSDHYALTYVIVKCCKKYGYPPSYKHKNKAALGSLNSVELATGTNAFNHQTATTQSPPTNFPFIKYPYQQLLALIQRKTQKATTNALTLTFPSFLDMVGKFLYSATKSTLTP